jgi:hypothetical protein
MSPEQAHEQAHEQVNRMGFREWTQHYEKEQELQRDQIGELTKATSSLTADVRTLVENQRTLHGRINRPQPVAAYVSALLASIAVMISFSTLLVNPIKEQIAHLETVQAKEEERNLNLHIMLKEDIERTIADTATLQENARWMNKMEERLNIRIHKGLQ